jgi:branched-chain amino acid aminotransferase
MTRNDVGNARRDAYLRITVSRGAGDIGLDPSLCPSPTVAIIARPLIAPAASFYDKGVPLIVAATRRNLPAALAPSIKSTNFLNNILAKREAIAAGAFDSVLLNWNQHLTECTASNLFFVTHDVLRTPSLDCGLLDGITRAIVIELAKELRIRVEEGRFTAEELYRATECFLTNTTMEIMPVSSVDHSLIGHGSPGPLTRTLQERFIAARHRFLEQPPSS